MTGRPHDAPPMMEHAYDIHELDRARLVFATKRLRQVRGSGAGISSDALSDFAMGGRRPGRSEFPSDRDDLGRCERAWRAMPPALRRVVAPVMKEYRAAVGKHEAEWGCDP